MTFVDSLPRTLTGKVRRFLLREWATETAPAEPTAMPAESEPPDTNWSPCGYGVANSPGAPTGPSGPKRTQDRQFALVTMLVMW